MVVMAKKRANNSFLVETDRGNVNLNRGMSLLIVYNDDREKVVGCGKVLNSEEIVKTIGPGEVLWADIKEEREISLNGLRFKKCKSVNFLIREEKNSWRWTISSEDQCEFMWILTGIDSTTHRIIFRTERNGDDIIVYSFHLP